MQASAASQSISPANIPAPQAKPDAHKANEASPFAILVDMAAAKDSANTAKKDVKNSDDRSPDDKPAVSKNDGSDAKQNDVKQNDDKQDDTRRDVAQTAPQSKPAAPAKSEKADKDKDAGEIGKDAPDDKEIAAVEQQLAGQQVLPPTPMVQASIAVPADTDTGAEAQEDIAIDSATAKPAIPAPGIDVPQSDPVDPAAKPETDAAAQPQTEIAAQDESQASDSEAVAVQSAIAPAVTADAKPAAKDEVKPVAVKTAAKTGDTKSDIASIESAKDAPVQAPKAGDETVHGTQAKPAKTDIAKDDGTNPAAPKTHAAHDNVASNTKTDTSDSHKADTPQAGAHPVEADNAPAAVKPAPQSASVSNAVFAINNIAAPQAAQHAQAPTATQHVQVTAQPAPNLPALAVEISAKSQSGAKQFDIRLDPPELGRVEVRLSIDATGKASAHLSADQPQTLTLLQKDAPILTRALREAGLDVAQDGLNFSLRQQAQGQNGNDGGNNGRFGGARTFALAASASIDPAAASFAYRGLADGRVDIRV